MSEIVKHTLWRRIGASLRWLPLLTVIVLVNVQCSGALPPLPATPAGPVVNVAVLSPTSGELATQGQSMRNGIQLAFDQWNDQGAAGQPRLEWIPYHTDCAFESAEQAVRQAVMDGIEFFIGPVCTEAAIAAAAEAAAARVLLISPAAPHPLVTSDSTGKTRQAVFGIAYTPDWQAYNAARFGLTELNTDRAAVLEPVGNRYGHLLADRFKTHFQTMGGTVVFTAVVEAATTDLTRVLTSSQESGAGLLYFPGSALNANMIASQLRQLQKSGDMAALQLLGSDAWDSPALDLSAVDGSAFPVQYTPFNPEPTTQSWRTVYKSTFAVEPDSLAALGFDAANALAQAVRHSRALTPDGVGASLELLEFEGVTGNFQFDAQHTPRKTVTFLRVQNQTLVPYQSGQ